jgi:hypothetical protein
MNTVRSKSEGRRSKVEKRPKSEIRDEIAAREHKELSVANLNPGAQALACRNAQIYLLIPPLNPTPRDLNDCCRLKPALRGSQRFSAFRLLLS